MVALPVLSSSPSTQTSSVSKALLFARSSMQVLSGLVVQSDVTSLSYPTSLTRDIVPKVSCFPVLPSKRRRRSIARRREKFGGISRNKLAISKHLSRTGLTRSLDSYYTRTFIRITTVSLEIGIVLRRRGIRLILTFGIRADWRQVPLLDALSFGCKSFEADIHLVGSGNDTDLLVSRLAVLVHPSELSFLDT